MFEAHRAASGFSHRADHSRRDGRATRQDRVKMMMMMKTKNSSSGLFFLLLLLLLSSLTPSLGSVVRRHLQFSTDHYTWQEAQSHCRSLNPSTDLATVYSQSDFDSLPMNRYQAWIGLRKKPVDESTPRYEWTWSNGQKNTLNFWFHHEDYYIGSCAVVNYSNRRFYGASCDESLFFICLNNDVSDPSDYDYTFVPESKTWFEAERYCRENFHDLALIVDYFTLNSAVRPQDFPVWIGLYRDGETWKWSTGLSDYRNWASDEQQNNGDCVSMTSKNEMMVTQNCSARFPSVCSRDNMVLVKENKTWEEALKHCRGLESTSSSEFNYELISVQPGDKLSYVMNRVEEADTEKVWSGLRFLAGDWLWMNREDMLLSDLPGCPDMGQHCGAFLKGDTGSVKPTDCVEKLNFLCYSTYD